MKSMVGKLPVILLALVVTAVFGLAACGGGDNGGGCPTGQNKCDDGVCHECCKDAQCSGGKICGAEHTCVSACVQSGADCSKAACCTGLGCDVFTYTCMTACSGSCASWTIPSSDERSQYKADLTCKNGICDFAKCPTGKDSECPGGKNCYAGDCVATPDCSAVASCSVVPQKGVSRQGATIQLSASAYLSTGALAPGQAFAWTSDDAGKASVNATTGLVTGGSTTGSTNIKATVCGKQCSATVMNYASIANGTRVVVVDELFGNPVAGAKVKFGADEQTTDANGIATSASDPPVDITVAHPGLSSADANGVIGYNYVTVLGAASRDNVIPVGPIFDTNKAAGFKGKFGFDMDCPAGNKCEIKIAFSGPSIPGSLVNLDFRTMFGSTVVTQITLNNTPYPVPLPEGAVISLNNKWFKQSFFPSGTPGTRVAWGLGGKLELGPVLNALMPYLAGGGTTNIDVGALATQLLPFIKGFYTALKPGLVLTPANKVQESTLDLAQLQALINPDIISRDLNGNGNENDYVPNYPAFVDVPGGLSLRVKMDKLMTITAPNLPAANPAPTLPGASQYYYDTVIVAAGAIVRDAGLVPLGMSVGLDSTSSTDAANGKIDSPIQLYSSEIAGRIPEDQIVKRVIVALGLNLTNLRLSDCTDVANPQKCLTYNLTGQVYFVDSFEGNLTLDEFLTPPNASIAGRVITFSGGSPVDFVQPYFMGTDLVERWNVLYNGSGSITLPSAPTGADDRFSSNGANWVGIKLQSGVTFADLTQFGDKNMANFVKLVKSFVWSSKPNY